MDKYLSTFIEAIQAITLLGGLVWAYVRFRKESPTKPRIELDVDADFLGPQQGQYIAGISIQVRNKGAVNHIIDRLELKIMGLKPDAPVQAHPNPQLGQRVDFSEKLFKSNNIIHPDYKAYFVRAGVQQTIYYHTAIPEDIRFVRVWAAFHYQGLDEKQKHTVERVFELKADQTSS